MLNQQDGNSSMVNKCQKKFIEFFVSGSNSPEPLDFLKEALDKMPLLIQIPVYQPEIRHIALGRDHIISFML